MSESEEPEVPETAEKELITAELEGGLSPLKITAIQIHEMFLALKEAGFRHQDAIQLLGLMLTSGVLFNPESTFGYEIQQEGEEEELEEESLLLMEDEEEEEE